MSRPSIRTKPDEGVIEISIPAVELFVNMTNKQTKMNQIFRQVIEQSIFTIPYPEKPGDYSVKVVSEGMTIIEVNIKVVEKPED